jgi:glycosyltransferase involved in cell wall biosynthesis
MILEGRALSGIGHYTVQLALWFARISAERGDNHRIVVYCRRPAMHHFGAIEGVEAIAVPFNRGRITRVLTEQLYLPLLMKRAKVDIVFNPAFTGPVLGARVIVTTVHDLYFRVVPDLLPRAQRMFLSTLVPFCCRHSSHIVTTSASTMRDLETFYPHLAGRVTVIPMANRLGSPLALPDRSTVDEAPFVLVVAALTANKNVGPLVEAIAIARRQHPNLKLVHVGRDPDGRLVDAIARHDGRDWIESKTGVSDHDLINLYGRCLCVAIPSLCEGFGLPLLEAQAFGAPVIASNRSALPEVGGEGAIYFDPSDPMSISEAINKLITSMDLRDALRHAGFANQARFTWKDTAEKMLGLVAATDANNEMP